MNNQYPESLYPLLALPVFGFLGTGLKMGQQTFGCGLVFIGLFAVFAVSVYGLVCPNVVRKFFKEEPKEVDAGNSDSLLYRSILAVLTLGLSLVGLGTVEIACLLTAEAGVFDTKIFGVFLSVLIYATIVLFLSSWAARTLPNRYGISVASLSVVAFFLYGKAYSYISRVFFERIPETLQISSWLFWGIVFVVTAVVSQKSARACLKSICNRIDWIRFFCLIGLAFPLLSFVGMFFFGFEEVLSAVFLGVTGYFFAGILAAIGPVVVWITVMAFAMTCYRTYLRFFNNCPFQESIKR